MMGWIIVLLGVVFAVMCLLAHRYARGGYRP
jgi:hypothetical protein